MTKKERAAEITMLTEEFCSCGHVRLIHGDTLGGLAKGHGRCYRNGCACEKFTWVSGPRTKVLPYHERVAIGRRHTTGNSNI